MATKRTPTAALQLRRPEQPITRSQLLEALGPLLQLLQADGEDVASLHVTHTSIRLQLVPRHRGRRQLDAMLRVTYPVVYDPEG